MLISIDKYRLFRHVAFWVTWLLFMSLFYGLNPKGNMFLHFFGTLGSSLPIYLIYSYLTVYFALPRLLLQRKVTFFVIYFILATFVFSLLLRIEMKFIFYRYFVEADITKIKLLDWISLLSDMLWVNVPLVMFASVKFIYGYSNELVKKKKLEKLNLNAELSLLTIQLRPHFLFNTLNNLYSMAINRDMRTSDGISRVINLLKYILYVCNAEKVQLKKEIGLIYDYIELEKLRYDERLDFNFELDIYDKDAEIAPMILFTFVENSFKHGSSIEVGNSFIHLNLKTNKSRLLFHSINSYPDNKPNQSSSGLGLENVRKRLDLLYPEKYKLEIEKKDQVFEVSLDLSL